MLASDSARARGSSNLCDTLELLEPRSEPVAIGGVRTSSVAALAGRKAPRYSAILCGIEQLFVLHIADRASVTVDGAPCNYSCARAHYEPDYVVPILLRREKRMNDPDSGDASSRAMRNGSGPATSPSESPVTRCQS
jgi:hypothetical protein